MTLVLAVVHGQLGYLGHELPVAGALHGLTAMVLFRVAVYAGRRMRTAPRSGVCRPRNGPRPRRDDRSLGQVTRLAVSEPFMDDMGPPSL